MTRQVIPMSSGRRLALGESYYLEPEMGSNASAPDDMIQQALAIGRKHLDDTLPNCLPTLGNTSLWICLAQEKNRNILGYDGMNSKEIFWTCLSIKDGQEIRQTEYDSHSNIDRCNQFTPNFIGGLFCFQSQCYIGFYHLLTKRDLLKYAQSRLPSGWLSDKYRAEVQRTSTSVNLIIRAL
jgi:hypothetical protein